jgi:hypothetical protein
LTPAGRRCGVSRGLTGWRVRARACCASPAAATPATRRHTCALTSPSCMCALRCRLDQEVTGLELHPTLEDVFHADTSSVEEYLQQIQDMTILTAIQVRVCVCVCLEGGGAARGRACMSTAAAAAAAPRLASRRRSMAGTGSGPRGPARADTHVPVLPPPRRAHALPPPPPTHPHTHTATITAAATPHQRTNRRRSRTPSCPLSASCLTARRASGPPASRACLPASRPSQASAPAAARAPAGCRLAACRTQTWVRVCVSAAAATPIGSSTASTHARHERA